jgi:hypothetical protein
VTTDTVIILFLFFILFNHYREEQAIGMFADGLVDIGRV